MYLDGTAAFAIIEPTDTLKGTLMLGFINVRPPSGLARTLTRERKTAHKAAATHLAKLGVNRRRHRPAGS